jgi:hypothetical protein
VPPPPPPPMPMPPNIQINTPIVRGPPPTPPITKQIIPNPVRKLGIPDANTIKSYTNTVGNRENFTNLFSNNFSDYITNMSGTIYEGLNDPNVSSMKMNSSFEQTLVSQLNQFNSDYSNYVHCNSGYSYDDCAGNNITVAQLQSELNNINNTINNIQKQNYNTNGNTAVSSATYGNNYNQIIQNYDDVTKMRRELDNKVKRLYDPNNSMIDDYINTYESSVYSGILITALATSILYYVFTEI